MPDYKEMYLTMVNETEKAITMTKEILSTLIEAQRRCEDMYINAPDENQDADPQENG